MDEDILGIIAVFLIVFVPVAGITARIALKPFNEAILLFLKNKNSDREDRLTDQRLALLEQEIQSLRGEVGAISEQKEFYQRLAEGGSSLPAAPPNA